MKCTRKEFYELAGCSKSNLSTYIKRGKVVLEKDGKTIDSNKRENADFLKHRESIGKAKGSVVPESETKAPLIDSKSQNLVQIKPTAKVRKAAENHSLSKYELDIEKIRAELEKKYVDTDLAKQKLSVLMGNNITIELVRAIVSQFSRSILTNYKSFSEQQINEICHQHRISDIDRAALVTKNTSGLNGIHKKAVSDARKQMKNAVGVTKLEELEKEDKQ